jgi:hypothetical protein
MGGFAQVAGAAMNSIGGGGASPAGSPAPTPSNLPSVTKPIDDIANTIGNVMNVVGGMFKGAPEQNGKLPFEIEKQMILDSQNNIATIQSNMRQSQQVYQAYVSQYNTLRKIAASGVPTAADMKAMSSANVDIAKAFGGNTLEAIKQGFIDKDTAKYSGLITDNAGVLQDNLAKVMSQDFKDPNLVTKQMQDRRTLQQQLARTGATQTQIAQQLQLFDQQANNQTFSRTEELRNQSIDQLSNNFKTTTAGYQAGFNALEAGKNQNFNQAVTGYNQLQNGLNLGQNAITNVSTMDNNMLAANNNYNANTNQNITAQQGIYNNIANTPLSLKTRGALGDDVSYGDGFFGMDKHNPANDPAAVAFRQQYQSAKQKSFATRI